MRPSISQCSSLKKEPGSGTLSRACLDDSYASGEGLKRSALSSSLRDLSEAGKSWARHCLPTQCSQDSACCPPGGAWAEAPWVTIPKPHQHLTTQRGHPQRQKETDPMIKAGQPGRPPTPPCSFIYILTFLFIF